MTSGRVVAGVTDIDGKIAEKHESTPNRPDHRMVGIKQAVQVIEVMRAWHRQAELNQQGLEVFFCRLLAMKANAVVVAREDLQDVYGAHVVGLGLFHPGGR